MNISIVIPTYNGGSLFDRALEKIVNQNYDGNIEIIIIDSGSTDETLNISRKYTNNVIQIKNEEFHHARTRNLALKYVSNEYVIFTVQDAVPKEDLWLSNLVSTLKNSESDAVYIKQVPHFDADIYARFETEYHSNYLGNNLVIQKELENKELEKLSFQEALKKIRMDNVCAIYKKQTLIENPFPEVDFAEDMAWAKLIITNGGSIIYNPNIEIYHSHNRTPFYRMKRAVVDTIFSTLILEKIENDRSHIDFESLKKIIEKIENFKYIYINNNYIDNENSVNLDFVGSDIVKAFVEHIKYLSDMIFNNYNVIINDEKKYVIEQISSSLIGTLIGQVYVSHLNKNTLSEDLEIFVNRYRVGV